MQDKKAYEKLGTSNKEKLLADTKFGTQENKEKHRASTKAYYEANKEEKSL